MFPKRPALFGEANYMRPIWLLARRQFTFKGTTYQEGQRFQALPIAAVQMHAMRAVSYARAPQAVPVQPSDPQPRRRGRPPLARPILAAPSPVVETAPVASLEVPLDPLSRPDESSAATGD